MQTGFENKRQMYLLGGLVALLVLAGAYEMKDSFSSPVSRKSAPLVNAQPVVATTAKPSPAADASAPEAKKIIVETTDPVLHTELLDASEKITYTGSGRNLFSADFVAAPVRIEAPVKSARREAKPAVVVPQMPEAPRPPSIELRYFGYAQSRDKSYKAFLTHGDEIFTAKVGEILNHRYKIVGISPQSVQVTDLGYNNTQSLPLQSN